MSRSPTGLLSPTGRFPCVSGDEPVYNRVVARGQEFSPRERG